MRLVSVVTAVAALLLCTHHASAFSMDSSTGSAPDGSSRYVDPDEQVRSMLGGKDDDSNDLGYDANSHHRKRPAQEIINGQGVLIPLTVPSGR
ncbi:MAG TPA: hypothetical protein VMM15_35090 [Bradyrhizobium sp.]|nr:hypothetical protein [Bradyrhizobium sp.]